MCSHIWKTTKSRPGEATWYEIPSRHQTPSLRSPLTSDPSPLSKCSQRSCKTQGAGTKVLELAAGVITRRYHMARARQGNLIPFRSQRYFCCVIKPYPVDTIRHMVCVSRQSQSRKSQLSQVAARLTGFQNLGHWCSDKTSTVWEIAMGSRTKITPQASRDVAESLILKFGTIVGLLIGRSRAISFFLISGEWLMWCWSFFSMKMQKYKTVAEANPLLREFLLLQWTNKTKCCLISTVTTVFLHFGEVFQILFRNRNIISLSYVIDVKNFFVHVIQCVGPFWPFSFGRKSCRLS